MPPRSTFSSIRRDVLPSISFLALSLVLAGCSAVQNGPWTESKADTSWYHSLREPTQPIPAVGEGPNNDSPLATPTDRHHLAGAWPWGSPKDLTQRQKASGAENAPSRGITPVRGLSGEDRGTSRGDANRSVVVNINQNQNVSDKQHEEENSHPADAAGASLLERLYEGRFDRTADRNLSQFGYDLFRNPADVTDLVGPVPLAYSLGPGDEVNVAISGAIEAFHQLRVERDGSITIPDFGTVSIAGVTFGDLEGHIGAFMEQRRKGFELAVSLGSLRSIQLTVVGNVTRPGSVEISALGNPLVALAAAGGPRKDGSLRSLRLLRGGKEADVDLYDILIGGGYPLSNLILQEGDTLQVPSIGPTIAVAGYVKRPAIYELSQPHSTVGEVLALAGGLTPFSFTPLAHLERTVDGRGRQRIDVSLEGRGLQQEMKDGEILLVEAVDDNRQPVVRIEGEVARPGDYEYRPGLTLKDLVERADGLTIEAYLPQAFISRQVGSSGRIDGIVKRTSHQQTQRVIVTDLEQAMMGAPQANLALMPLDLVTIRSNGAAQTKAFVEILGPVQQPGEYHLTAGMRVSDLVAMAGNPLPSAYFDEAELIRQTVDEVTRQLDVRRFRFNLGWALKHPSDPSKNPLLRRGDQLVIRERGQSQIRVSIDGQIPFPGSYIFPAGATIIDLMTAAGGLLEDADLRAARFTRENTKRQQQQHLQHLTERTRQVFERAQTRMFQRGQNNESAAATLSLENAGNTLNRLRALQADGRIVIDFLRDDFPESAFNLVLESGDNLVIPRRHRTVNVAGHVFRPIAVIAEGGITTGDALQHAGGITELADKELIYVIRADGRVDRVARRRGNTLRRKTILFPGDSLVVPEEPLK
ncbi:MAG: SLBB domain-containing protein, partial [Verrucomicrobiota bacterium]